MESAAADVAEVSRETVVATVTETLDTAGAVVANRDEATAVPETMAVNVVRSRAVAASEREMVTAVVVVVVVAVVPVFVVVAVMEG